jgi:hypothetical protein
VREFLGEIVVIDAFGILGGDTDPAIAFIQVAASSHVLKVCGEFAGVLAARAIGSTRTLAGAKSIA